MRVTVNRILVLFDIKHPYDRKITDGILDAMHQANHSLHMTFMTYDEALLVARDHEWDAVIADFDRTCNVDLCASLGAPVVAVRSNLQTELTLALPSLVYVAPDTDRYCEQARDHLLACGVKHFAFFAGMARDIGLWAEERHRSLKRLVASAGLDWAGDYDTYTIRDYLEQGLARKTGFLCASDTQARQLITLANNLSIDVPGQLSVIGIDNDETENQLSLVPISTVTLAPHELGKAAFKALFDLDNSCQPRYRLIPPGPVLNRLSAYLEVDNDTLVSEALKYIHKHYHRPIKAEQVIQHCCTSRNTLESRFKKALNKTVHQVLYDIRLESAKDMLANTPKSIDDVARQCGLSSPQYLYYLFNKNLGMTPTHYRKTYSALP